MRIAITGAGGMIGRACVRRFARRGDEVVALSRTPLDWRTGSTGTPRAVAGRVTDYSTDDLASALQGVDAVIHLAAMRMSGEADAIGFRPYQEANVQITENILRACLESGTRKICLASTVAVYFGAGQSPVTEALPPCPTGFYGLSKLCCENLAFVYGIRFPLNAVCLRIAQVIGLDETRTDNMLMRFMALAARRQPLPLWGEGAGARDTIYVEDVVEAFECALAADGVSGVFNIGGGCAVSNREVAETINEVFDNVGNLTFDRTRREDTSNLFMDCSRAERELGWRRQWSLRAAFADLKRDLASTAP
ncbi:MAG: NAD(P)-dependent oxidoreductase [Rhodospirillales bacterium]|nr:MAG: NAD(P)-dependent oxidoreductase [Rhodospirillales bacterium]